MPISRDGRDKLTEEMGELLQVIGKKNAYELGTHPDGAGDLDERMIEEMGDVLAAIQFVTESHDLDGDAVVARAEMKSELFNKWSKEK